MPSPPDLSLADLKAGLVLHLDPDVLESSGGTYGCAAEQRVQGHHFFLCIEASGQTGRWLPVYSGPGIDRTKLPTRGRSGHPKWLNANAYYHVAQVWSAPCQAVIAAAIAGGDQSTKQKRNTLNTSLLPSL